MRLNVRTRPGHPVFRRAGLTFTLDAKDYEVTDEQAALIKAEPMLIVTAKKKAE